MKTNLSKTLVTSVMIATGIAFISLNYSPPLFAQSNSNSPQPTPKMLHDSVQRMMREQIREQIRRDRDRMWNPIIPNYPITSQDLQINDLWRLYSDPMYDPSRVETIQGTVLEIEPGKPGHWGNQMPHGVHLFMKTNTETLAVHVGPVWYLEQQNFQIKPNEILEVTGMRVNLGGQQRLIVGEIKKENQTLQLRDENGYPRWMARQRQTPVN